MLHVLVMAPSACCNERGVALNTANSLCASAIAVFSSATSLSKDVLIFCASANALGACFLRTASTCASLSEEVLWRLAILKTSNNTALRKGAVPHVFHTLLESSTQKCLRLSGPTPAHSFTTTIANCAGARCLFAICLTMCSREEEECTLHTGMSMSTHVLHPAKTSTHTRPVSPIASMAFMTGVLRIRFSIFKRANQRSLTRAE